MPTFTYHAVDLTGRRTRGTITADTPEMAQAQLLARNLRPLQIEERKGGGGLGSISFGGKVKLTSLVVFARQFAFMIDAGIRQVQALETLERQTPDPAFKPVLRQMKEDLVSGAQLSEAMAKHPKVFEELVVNMVRAGETSGQLDRVMERLADLLEKRQEIIEKVRSAMMYPVMVISASLLITAGLVVGVLPRFKEIYSELRDKQGNPVELPTPTKVLFAISDFARAHFWLFPLILIALVVGLKLYGKTPRGRYNLDWLKLKIPIMGPMIHKLAISRFARTFATLQSAGVQVMRSLEIVGSTSGNRVIQKAVEDAREEIREGRRLADTLEASGWFPPMVIQMMQVGEETGKLPEMLSKVADFFEREVDAQIKGLTSILEPLMIIILGVIIGGIVMATITPIFKLQRALM